MSSSNNTLSHEIANTLRDEVLCQQYRSGERLPSERDLAARFSASRGAVREALSQLEQLGLIAIQPGGARVQSIDAASISVLGPLMALEEVPNPTLVDQFLQTFGALAAVSAREAISRGSDEQLNQMQNMVVSLYGQACHGQTGDSESMQTQLRELLEYLGEVADNLVVKLIGNDLKAQFVEQMVKLGINPMLKQKETNRMLDSLRKSLEDRDSELAGVAIQLYFDELRQAVADAIQARTGGYQQQVV